MTLRELYRELVAAHRSRQEAHERDLTLAWSIEALRRQKKLPALKTLLQSSGARRPEPSVAQHRTMLAMLSERYGIPLGKTHLIRKGA